MKKTKKKSSGRRSVEKNSSSEESGFAVDRRCFVFPLARAIECPQTCPSLRLSHNG